MKDFYCFPLTVEFWAKCPSGGAEAVLICAGPRDDIIHWELSIPRWSSGDFGAIISSNGPLSVVSPLKVKKDEWRYFACVIGEKNVKLYVDAEEVAAGSISSMPKPEFGPKEDGRYGLLFGTDGIHDCQGLVDEVRISEVAREIKAVPNAPFEADDHTIGLWHFDKADSQGRFVDSSSKANHARFVSRPKVSLDEVDRQAFGSGPSPIDTKASVVSLKRGAASQRRMPKPVSLNGLWQMAQEGSQEQRLAGQWDDAFSVHAPASANTQLFEAGRMPDPTVGKNVQIARKRNFVNYWFKKEFPRPAGISRPKLVLEGVSEAYSIWLNGHDLGRYVGKYIPREFDISPYVQDTNTLIVKVDAIRRREVATNAEAGWYDDAPIWDKDDDITIGATAGWHYVRCAPQGIWRSVWIEQQPEIRIESPFVATRDTKNGTVDLVACIRSERGPVRGKLSVSIRPENFTGNAYHFEEEVTAKTSGKDVHYRFNVPKCKLWWPVDLGDPNLYRMTITFAPANGAQPATREVTFGIRTIENRPLPGGPYPDKYNWQFVVNGRLVFLKGANWCTLDVFFDLSRKKYERFLGLARSQHVQALRAWGAGMYETETFYDVCDRMGIMVYQEFPIGPYEITEKTVRSFIPRMRNHPSLIWYGGGNEIAYPYGQTFLMMGRSTIEMDGTRPFHRTDPWGGSMHDYSVYWGNASLDFNLTLQAPFVGEFGFTSPPNIESVMRYLPEDEKSTWPPDPKGSFAFHSPAFNRDADYGRDMSHMERYLKLFASADTMDSFITGVQLAHATALRHPLEMARARWPEAAGICYYKLTDIFPACSYSCIDWYGVPKLVHYVLMDAYQPLAAVVGFSKLNPMGEEVRAPVSLLDDAGRLAGRKWEVTVRAFGSNLAQVKRADFRGKGATRMVKRIGEFVLSADQAKSTPLFMVTDVRVDGELQSRNWYWLNFETRPGCLFDLPKTTLSVSKEKDCFVVKNEGKAPALGVHFVCPDISDEFFAEDGYFWLDPGEAKTVKVNQTAGVSVAAWNFN
jgi:beta-mannosidase